jgi:hypothetical protein
VLHGAGPQRAGVGLQLLRGRSRPPNRGQPTDEGRSAADRCEYRQVADAAGQAAVLECASSQARNAARRSKQERLKVRFREKEAKEI